VISLIELAKLETEKIIGLRYFSWDVRNWKEKVKAKNLDIELKCN